MGIARRSNSKNHRRLREEAASAGGLLKYTEGSSVDYRVWLRIQDGMEPPARAVAFLARRGYEPEDWGPGSEPSASPVS